MKHSATYRARRKRLRDARKDRQLKPYELPCGCWLRRTPDGGWDQLTCKEHSEFVINSICGFGGAHPDGDGPEVR